MTLVDFVKVRKNAVPFELLPEASPRKAVDVTRLSQSLFEDDLQQKYFQSAFYNFKQGELDRVALHGDFDVKDISNLSQPFLAEILQLYGKPSFICLAEIPGVKGPINDPVLMWQKGAVCVAAFLPVEDKQDRTSRQRIDLKLGHFSDVGQLILRFSSAPKAEREEILSPVRLLIQKAFPGEAVTEYLPHDEQQEAEQPNTGPANSTFKSPVPAISHTISRVLQSNNGDFWPSWMEAAYDDVTYIHIGRYTRATTLTQNENLGQDDFSSIVSNPEKTTLIIALPDKAIDVATCPANNRIAFTVCGAVYVLDVKNSTIGRLNDPERTSRSTPSWDSTGSFLLISGTHSLAEQKNNEQDIFLVNVAEKLSIRSAKSSHCIIHLSGRDILPVFSSDDKWVTFSHEEKQGDAKGWAIYRCKIDKRSQAPDYFKPEKLVEGLPEPERLSPFPDGKRVLLSYTGNDYEMKNPPEIVDIEAKTRTPLKLPALLDPDLPKGKPLVPREIAVSPDDKQIAFSALRWSGDPKDDGAILIYTCNLDGTNLKRITPPTDVPLEPYQYPQPGVTGLNAWEKLQPKPSLGTPIDLTGTSKIVSQKPSTPTVQP